MRSFMLVLSRFFLIGRRFQNFLIVLGLLLTAGLAQSTVFAADSDQSKANLPPIAFAARVIGDSNRARLIVDFDKDVIHDAYVLDNPKRIIVDLPETVFSLDGELKRLPKSLVSDLRYGTVALGRSRIILELAKPVMIESHRVKQILDENRYRLIVDLVKASPAQFAKAVRVNPKKSISQKQAKPSSKKRFTIVIDPGHGGVDGGASGEHKTREKEITLSFAKKLKALLARNKNFIPILTREGDDFIRLTERVEIARKHKADLFISVHADSLRQKEIRGATVYILSNKGSDDISTALAETQNRTDLIAGLSLPEEKPDVSNILIDMTRRETKAFSKRVASLLVKRLEKDVKLINNPLRSADFYVLKAPEIPSVLLELGYLSNNRDETLMRSDEWQSLAALRLFEAIRDFFRERAGVIQ